MLLIITFSLFIVLFVILHTRYRITVPYVNPLNGNYIFERKKKKVLLPVYFLFVVVTNAYGGVSVVFCVVVVYFSQVGSCGLRVIPPVLPPLVRHLSFSYEFSREKQGEV